MRLKSQNIKVIGQTLFCVFFCSGIVIHAGIPDYIVYDRRNRYQLELLDGIVSVKIKGYCAFADAGLVQTVIEERKRANLRVPRESSLISFINIYGSEIIYDPAAGRNEPLQLLRNSLWLMDVEIIKCFSGSFDTNRVFVAMRPSRAYFWKEHPYNVVKNTSGSTVVLGLVHIDDNEFMRSFRGLVCYLKDDLSFFESDFNDGHLDDRAGLDTNYENIFSKFTPSPCYVVREIGIQPPKQQGEKLQESKLMVAFKEQQDKNCHPPDL